MWAGSSRAKFQNFGLDSSGRGGKKGLTDLGDELGRRGGESLGFGGEVPSATLQHLIKIKLYGTRDFHGKVSGSSKLQFKSCRFVITINWSPARVLLSGSRHPCTITYISACFCSLFPCSFSASAAPRCSGRVPSVQTKRCGAGRGEGTGGGGAKWS